MIGDTEFYSRDCNLHPGLHTEASTMRDIAGHIKYNLLAGSGTCVGTVVGPGHSQNTFEHHIEADFRDYSPTSNRCYEWKDLLHKFILVRRAA